MVAVLILGELAVVVFLVSSLVVLRDRSLHRGLMDFYRFQHRFPEVRSVPPGSGFRLLVRVAGCWFLMVRVLIFQVLEGLRQVSNLPTLVP